MSSSVKKYVANPRSVFFQVRDGVEIPGLQVPDADLETIQALMDEAAVDET